MRSTSSRFFRPKLARFSNVRKTIDAAVLAINDPQRVQLRKVLMDEREWPDD